MRIIPFYKIYKQVLLRDIKYDLRAWNIGYNQYVRIELNSFTNRNNLYLHSLQIDYKNNNNDLNADRFLIFR